MQQERTKEQPASVRDKQTSQQAGEIQNRWWWVEPGTWTKRMLTRLEQSESTTKWFRLWEKVWSPRNLRAGYWAVWRNRGAPGVDGQRIAEFGAREEEELKKLGEELSERRYRPHPARRVWIDKPGSHEKRPLGIPAVRDRVVQAALRNLLEPIFERDFAEHSYGFRPGRGCRQAVKRVEEQLNRGNAWVVDADIKGYFDNIPHEKLMELIAEKVVDGSVLGLLEKFLKAGVMEPMKGWKPTKRGSPQGAVISPLLANVYLNPLDHAVAGKGWEMVRYADDFVVLCADRAAAEAALAFIKEWADRAGLTLHPEKTRIVNADTERFDFLGWTMSRKRGRSRKWPRRKSVAKLREKLKPMTKRTNGQCLKAITGKINPILKGWRGYFGESLPGSLRTQDGWIRRRLRSMLRKRQKRPGFGRCKKDQQKWPNRWFAEQGLYSLEHGTCSYG